MKKIILILTIIFAIIAIIILLPREKPEEKSQYFTPEPETWIEEKDYTDDEDDIEINVMKATRAKSSVVNHIQQDYYLDEGIKSFFYRGSYNGTPIRTSYVDEAAFDMMSGKSTADQEIIANKYLKMRIAPEIDPTDGAINGFILAKQEEQMVFYIFVDQDWKDQLEYTNIVWGDNFKDESTLHVRPFDFSNKQNGIYIDVLREDVDWHTESITRGGIAVGEIDFNILQSILSFQFINETFMYIR